MQIPASTYRIQLNPHFNLEQAKNILPYLKKLGISWVYLSPIMQANPGSLHGYDVTDPNQINEEIGGAKKFDEFCQILNKLNMGLLLDFVPNHMAATQNNPWWKDVTDQRSASKYAYLFDIFWNLSAAEKIVYRRFFDINELVCLRMEDPAAFIATHRLILQLLRNNPTIGVRLDHIDGLKDPNGYLNLLQTELNKPVYIVAEKILARKERLPSNWKISGTTGYDFLNELNQVFIKPAGFKSLFFFYENWLDSKINVADLRYLNNKLVIENLFKNEFDNLADSLNNIAHLYLNSPDKTQIEKLILELCAIIPVYRTYINNYPISAQDKKIVAPLLKNMKKESIKIDYMRLIKNAFTLTPFDAIHQQEENLWLDWLARWQVFTGPMVAKGYEDTTSYQYNLLLSLNEVGSEPAYFDAKTIGNLMNFHTYNQYKQSHYSKSLNATSTHDTKRSEDVRARLNVLTEISKEWQQAVLRWHRWNQSRKIVINNQEMPDLNDEFMIYQTLICIWPLHCADILQFKIRLHEFLTKAAREAKVHSSWNRPNVAYERALISFCDALLNESSENEFLPDFIKLQKKVAFFGMLNSLAQIVLKITCPGIPDFYQGNEVWQFDLVDPGNRHPINYDFIIKQFSSMQSQSEHPAQFFKKLLDSWSEGQIKLYVTYKLLTFRRDNPKIFSEGQYIPLMALGSKSDNVVSFMRYHGNEWLLIVVPRWCSEFCAINQTPLAAVWEDTRIVLPAAAPQKWRSVLTNEDMTHRQGAGFTFHLVSDLLNKLPLGIYRNATKKL